MQHVQDVQDPEEQVAARSDLDEHTDDEEAPQTSVISVCI